MYILHMDVEVHVDLSLEDEQDIGHRVTHLEQVLSHL